MADSTPLLGHQTHRYQVIPDWGTLNPATHPVNDCHEMVIDAQGRIFLLTNETRNNILVYDRAGNLLDSWGTEYPGGHGLSIANENGAEFLFITDIERHQVIKTTLKGQVVMTLDYPAETGLYTAAEQFLPTQTAVGPNGDVYVTDGYGLQYVIQYTHEGKYIRHWGGLGSADEQFDCAHGIAVDRRNPAETTLLITSRNHNAFKRFTLDGQYLSTISLPGSFVCRPVIHGPHVYAAVFRSESNRKVGSGYITILDAQDRVVSTPGGTEPVYTAGRLQPQTQQEPVFIHPHDVCVDDEENVYVCQWSSHRTYPLKLERVRDYS
ncbi:peptidylglycine monooxygenase-like protein [Larkinella knui]|uniref:6-bladed beta-propeller n=1 Tax=Larkinella knui TaxID=2025310 RepID=A0A3P1CNH5_9BACT|nr:6-bladed beta-propeller [Larkinella knui]RRB14883.1 6-bladed beta-propeller [Larkinella knui]